MYDEWTKDELIEACASRGVQSDGKASVLRDLLRAADKVAFSAKAEKKAAKAAKAAKEAVAAAAAAEVESQAAAAEAAAIEARIASKKATKAAAAAKEAAAAKKAAESSDSSSSSEDSSSEDEKAKTKAKAKAAKAKAEAAPASAAKKSGPRNVRFKNVVRRVISGLRREKDITRKVTTRGGAAAVVEPAHSLAHTITETVTFAVTRQKSIKLGSVESLLLQMKIAGLTSSQLCVFIDCTKSNSTQGAKTYPGRPNLHDITDPKALNPYQQVISYVGKTLAGLDADGQIPLYGFGDAHTTDKSVFQFPGAGPGGFCEGFEGVLKAYANKIGTVGMAGPTSYRPAIMKTIDLVKGVKGAMKEMHMCLILTDNQPERAMIRETEAAITEVSERRRHPLHATPLTCPLFLPRAQASKYPIEIVIVGIGDGPFDDLQRLDDLESVETKAARKFDNVQFVSLNTAVAAAKEKNISIMASVALSCLEEFPGAFSDACRLKLFTKNH